MKAHPAPHRSGLVDRVHLVVDLENLCGGSEGVPRHVSDAHSALSSAVPLQGAQVVLSVGVRAYRRTPQLPFVWNGARLLLGRGIDGADLRLLEDLLEEPQARRSSTVIIASGDGCFAPAATALRSRGVHTVALAREGTLSSRLRKAVNTYQYISVKGV